MPATPMDSEVFNRWSRRAACFLAVVFVLIFLDVALHRLRYPFELDRMESGMMTSVWRLAHGRGLYSAPTMEWVPFLYAPLFFYLSAALSHVTGMGYQTLRLVSVASTCGSFLAVYGLVYRETKHHAAALVSVGLLASLYELCLGWFDIGRVDSLSVFLFLAALYAMRWMHPVVAACIWLLAFQTKQTFLPFGVLTFLPMWRRPGRMVTGIVTFLALAGASVVWLNHATAGWYGHYAFGTTQQLGLVMRQAALFLPLDVFRPLPVVMVVLVAAWVVSPPNWRSEAAGFYGFMTLLLFGAMGFVRAHQGANLNAVIPLYAWLAVLCGLAIDRILKWIANPEQGLSRRVAGVASGVVWLAVAGQLAGHFYQTGHFIPQPADRGYREAMLEAVRATPGDVWLVNHSWDGIVAGKEVHPEMDALDAVLGLPYPPTVAEFDRLIQEQHFAAILTDRAAATYHPDGIFTSEMFRGAYGVRVAAPGAEQPGVIDQPAYAYLPCGKGTSAALLGPGMVADRTGCEGR